VVGYLIVGGVGLAIIALALVVGELFEHIFSALDADGAFSSPVVGSFLAAFGFGAALATPPLGAAPAALVSRSSRG
jgi:hypothetical protein